MITLNKEFTHGTVKSTVVAKKLMQQILRDMRHNGFIVTKLDAGYTVHQAMADQHVLVLKAMNGTRGYLTRYVEQVLTF
jgi:tRNA A58 N-methylase Trm61